MQIAHMKAGWMPEMGKLVVVGHGDCPGDGEQLKQAILTAVSHKPQMHVALSATERSEAASILYEIVVRVFHFCTPFLVHL